MRERSSRPGRLYAAIPNEAMRDSSISIEARGMLALLMTYSDDWVFRRDHLQEVSGLGRDKFERVMGELRTAGYVELQQMREQGSGRLLGRTWVIRDHRSPENPGVGVTEALKNRHPAEPTPGESAHIRRTTLQEEQNGRTPLPPEGDLFGDSQSSAQEPQPKPMVEKAKIIEEKFKEFYKVYPKKVGPDAAQKNFAKAVKGGADPDEIIAGARRYADWLASGGPRDFRPNPKNPQGWLTEGRWKDDLQEDKPARTHRLRENWAGVER